ncbi:hypothetical protein DSECCO2_528960 [anaerobic digester metagenome]
MRNVVEHDGPADAQARQHGGQVAQGPFRAVIAVHGDEVVGGVRMRREMGGHRRGRIAGDEAQSTPVAKLRHLGGHVIRAGILHARIVAQPQVEAHHIGGGAAVKHHGKAATTPHANLQVRLHTKQIRQDVQHGADVRVAPGFAKPRHAAPHEPLEVGGVVVLVQPGQHVEHPGVDLRLVQGGGQCRGPGQ